MGCLNGYVGLTTGCGGDSPPSGFRLNSIPGISFKQMQSIAEGEQEGMAGAWSDIQARAEISFDLALNAQMGERYRLLNPKHNYNLSKAVDTSTQYAGGTYQSAGFTVRMNKGFTDYPDSLLASIYCQQLAFYALSAGDVTIKVFNLDSGDELFSTTQEMAVGWNTVEVNRYFSNYYSDNALALYCCALTNTVDTVKKELNIDLYRTDNELVFKGGTTTISSSITDADVTEGENSFGLTGIFSSTCSWEALKCQNKNIFLPAWIYILVVETMSEQLGSDRFNQYTTIKKEKAAELKVEYQAKFDDAIKQACKSVDIDTSDACVLCDEQYQTVEALP